MPDPLVAPVVDGTPAVEIYRLVQEIDRMLCDADADVRDMHMAAARATIQSARNMLAALVPRPEPREPEPQSLPQKWREHAQWLRRSGNTFTAARIEDCASDLENAAVRPASAPSSRYPIRAHVEGCPKALRVPVDLCECGGRDVTPDPSASAPSRPLEEDRMRTVLALCFNRQITAEEALQRLRVLVPGGDPQEP